MVIWQIPTWRRVSCRYDAGRDSIKIDAGARSSGDSDLTEGVIRAGRIERSLLWGPTGRARDPSPIVTRYKQRQCVSSLSAKGHDGPALVQAHKFGNERFDMEDGLLALLQAVFVECCPVYRFLLQVVVQLLQQLIQ